MTQRVTISVPDDVAEQLAALPPRQVSAYVTETLRRRRASEDVRVALRAAGHREFPYDPEGAQKRLASRQVTREMRETVIARVAELMGRSVDEVRADFDRGAASEQISSAAGLITSRADQVRKVLGDDWPIVEV